MKNSGFGFCQEEIEIFTFGVGCFNQHNALQNLNLCLLYHCVRLT